MAVALHIGAHKTASTHLQHSLRACRAAFSAAGLNYLDPTDLRAGGFRLGLIAQGGPRSEAAARRFAEAVAGEKRVLLSEENILGSALPAQPAESGRLYPEAPERLARVTGLLGERPVQLFLAVRDPAGFLVSSYGQRLVSGVIEPFDSYLAGRDPSALRWADLAGRLAGVPGVQGITIWRYEDWPQIAPAVFARMLPADLAQKVQLTEGVVHPGLSARAHEWIMEELALGRASAETPRTARARFPKRPGEAGIMPFDDEARARIARAYADDLSALRAMAGVHMLERCEG